MSTTSLTPGLLTPLRRAGFAVLPAPRRVELTGDLTAPAAGWRLPAAADAAQDHGPRALRVALAARGVLASSRSRDAGRIEWEIVADTVATGLTDTRHDQAYCLRIEPGRVRLAGNAPAGLFYGFQTLVQLLESSHQPGSLPCGEITDWPERELRIVHWDTKHHQDRLATLRRYLDEMARFKLNTVCFEIEDKFAYPSHPIIGAPGAFTTDELAGLVRYGLERHIQIVPNLQAPAHMCYVLKHPEFAHLRCDGSNYQICMDEPEARRLIFDLYDDLVRATPGVSYFHVSTDEVYYAGICEKFRRPYNPVNRSLTWVDFVLAAHAFLRERGRRVILWAEYPLLPEHLPLLPSDIIDGVVGNEKFLASQMARDMRQIIYAPLQGSTALLPRYFPFTDTAGIARPGSLRDNAEQYLHGRATRGNPIGAFSAAWDDAGLHNETFWPGWVSMAQYAWGNQPVALEQTIADFMDVFYGTAAVGMAGAWRDLHDGATFCERTWDRVPSRARGPSYGEWDEKRPVTRTDRTLTPPALPDPRTFSLTPTFRASYGRLLDELPARRAACNRALDVLFANLGRAPRNRYNLEVLLSIAWMVRHHCDMLAALAAAEDDLVRASRDAADGKRDEALAALKQALARVDGTIADLDATRAAVTAVWEGSRLPRNAPVDGKTFLHVMDDVKDHGADRTADMGYLFGPELSMDLPGWRARLAVIAGERAAAALAPAPDLG
jgi:hypothetical protein